MQPRFKPDNFESNLRLVDAIKEVATQNGCTAAQVALAWVLEQGEHVVAIPGTTRLANLQANLGALDCHLSDDARTTLNTLADKVLGGRY
jgi:pyridoxine 4-dehydrogenase